MLYSQVYNNVLLCYTGNNVLLYNMLQMIMYCSAIETIEVQSE